METNKFNVEPHRALLERIATQYKHLSPEYQSIKLATQALLFIYAYNYEDEFLESLNLNVELPTNEKEQEIQLVEHALERLQKRLEKLRASPTVRSQRG